MDMGALGSIETYGLVAAVEAADSALKAANVKLLNLEYVTGGLITVLLVGDVSAVQSAVDAGKASASRIGEVVSTSVIPRMADSVSKMVTMYEDDEVEEIEEESKAGCIVDFKDEKIDITDEEVLEEMKVVELRQLVRSIEGIDMENEEIKFGRKDELISILLEYGKGEGK